MSQKSLRVKPIPTAGVEIWEVRKLKVEREVTENDSSPEKVKEIVCFALL